MNARVYSPALLAELLMRAARELGAAEVALDTFIRTPQGAELMECEPDAADGIYLYAGDVRTALRTLAMRLDRAALVKFG